VSFNPRRSARTSLGGEIYAALRERIVTLELEPGEMIYENAVASSFGVSRTPVREALNRLHQEDLIRILPQRGACVAHLSAKKIREAQFIREMLECGAFKIVAASWNRDDPKYRKAEKDLLSLLDDQKEAVRRGNLAEYIDLDAAYHTRILELVDNETLLQVLEVVRAHLNRMRYLELKEGRHELESIKHHEQLLELLMRNDAEQTEKLLIHHLRYIVNDWGSIMSKYAKYFE